MRLNLKSIYFKLIFGGVVAVLIPMIVVGTISTVKARSALLHLSMNQARDITSDLAKMTYNSLIAEISLAQAIAGQKSIADLLHSIEMWGYKYLNEYSYELFSDFKSKFANMAEHSHGVFTVDANGQLITGILENGQEYGGANISDKDYFQEVIKNGRAVLSDITVCPITGHPIIIACVPVKASDGKVLGMVGSAIKAGFINDLISSRKIGNTGFGFMIDHRGLFLSHPDKELVLKSNATAQKGMADVAKRMVEGETGITEYTNKGVRKIIAFAPVGLNGWSIGATQDESEFLAAAVAIRKANIIVALVAGVIMAGLIMLAATSMIKPINAAVAGLKDIAKGEGNLSMRLQVTSHNEIGELSRWFNVFIEKLQGIIKEISKGVHILHSSSSTLSAISEEMNHKIKDVSSRHNLLSAAAEEMSTAINDVAASMGQSAVNVNGVAMASKEMSKTISEIAQNTENARMISETASQKASNASVNIDELGHAARSIGNVIDTITDISEQVNLLALNATIEAARAGESGRGFAVVANEIKELANQTAHATDEIKTKVRSIQNTTSITIEQINDITKVIKGVNEAVGNIATAVELQNSATKEIAVNVSQASEGIQDVNESVDQISTAASGISKDTAEVNNAINEMSKDSAQVSLSSQDLLTLSEKLEHMVKQFKGA